MKSLPRIALTLHRRRLVGGLAGIRWLRVITKGRKSGKSHEVLVDVVDSVPERGIFRFQSAYGSASDWVRNIEAGCEVRIDPGDGPVAARVRALDQASARAVIERYVGTHPLYSRLVGILLGYRGSLARKPLADWLTARFRTFEAEKQEP